MKLAGILLSELGLILSTSTSSGLVVGTGGGHLDGYVRSPETSFAGDGVIPHCPRGNGRLIGAWRHPVLVSPVSVLGDVVKET